MNCVMCDKEYEGWSRFCSTECHIHYVENKELKQSLCIVLFKLNLTGNFYLAPWLEAVNYKQII